MLPSSKIMSGERKECDGVGDVSGVGSIRDSSGTVDSDGNGVDANANADPSSDTKERNGCLGSTFCCWRGK